MNNAAPRVASVRRSLREPSAALVALLALGLAACDDPNEPDSPGFRATVSSLESCLDLIRDPRPVADERADRFLGKVAESTAECRGGTRALEHVRRGVPYIDWPSDWTKKAYWSIHRS